MNPLWLAAIAPTLASLIGSAIVYGAVTQKGNDNARRLDILEPKVDAHAERLSWLEAKTNGKS